MPARVPAPAEAQSGAAALHDRLVPVRDDADSALGDTAASMGLLSSRRHPRDLQGGSGHYWGFTKPTQGAKDVYWSLRDVGSAAFTRGAHRGGGVHHQQYDATESARRGLPDRAHTPKGSPCQTEGTAGGGVQRFRQRTSAQHANAVRNRNYYYYFNKLLLNTQTTHTMHSCIRFVRLKSHRRQVVHKVEASWCEWPQNWFSQLVSQLRRHHSMQSVC